MDDIASTATHDSTRSREDSSPNQAIEQNRQKSARFGLASQSESVHRGRVAIIEAVAHRQR